MKDDFLMEGRLLFRKSKKGRTLYCSVTVSDQDLVREIAETCKLKNVTAAKVLNSFIKRAFAAGVLVNEDAINLNTSARDRRNENESYWYV